MPKLLKKVKEEVSEEKSTEPAPIISSGSMLLNLACSDNIFGAYQLGRMVNVVGDSSSGKTILCLSMLADTCYDSRFNDYRMIYDDVEAALSMDLEYLFGSELPNRLEANEPSNNIQEWYGKVLRLIKDKEHFIYVLDSFDALTSLEEQERAGKYAEDKMESGSYKMEKQKFSSEMFRVIARDIERTKSLLCIVSQTRDNIGYGAMFNPKTRSGGNALKFYSSHEIWLSKGSAYKAKERIIGIDCKASVKKNKFTGKIRNVDFPIYYDYGIDNVGSCVDFLLEEGVWKKGQKKIEVPEFEFEGTRDALVKLVDSSDEKMKLVFDLVQNTWVEVEESIRLNRRRRYADPGR